MARHHKEHIEILRELTQVARRKDQFTTSELRSKLGYVQGSTEARVMHSLIVTLKKAEIIKPTAAGRKRNQFLYVIPEKSGELDARYDRARRLGGDDNRIGTSGPRGVLPDTPRVVKDLERRVKELEEQLQILNLLVPLVDDLALVPEKLDFLASDVSRLIDMWS